LRAIVAAPKEQHDDHREDDGCGDSDTGQDVRVAERRRLVFVVLLVFVLFIFIYACGSRGRRLAWLRGPLGLGLDGIRGTRRCCGRRCRRPGPGRRPPYGRSIGSRRRLRAVGPQIAFVEAAVTAISGRTPAGRAVLGRLSRQERGLRNEMFNLDSLSGRATSAPHPQPLSLREEGSLV
jgi:hypothetical protein